MVGLFAFVLVILGYTARAGPCLADMEACLPLADYQRGQDVCIDKCEIECLGQRAACLKTERCARCMGRAFVGCGLGERSCVERQTPLVVE